MPLQRVMSMTAPCHCCIEHYTLDAPTSTRTHLTGPQLGDQLASYGLLHVNIILETCMPQPTAYHVSLTGSCMRATNVTRHGVFSRLQ
jgi:hypothetical protein